MRKITVGNAVVQPGEHVEVSVTVDEISRMQAFRIRIAYDPEKLLVSPIYTLGPPFSGAAWSPIPNFFVTGMITFGAFGTKPLDSKKNQTLVTFGFYAKYDAEGTTSLNLIEDPHYGTLIEAVDANGILLAEQHELTDGEIKIVTETDAKVDMFAKWSKGIVWDGLSARAAAREAWYAAKSLK